MIIVTKFLCLMSLSSGSWTFLLGPSRHFHIQSSFSKSPVSQFNQNLATINIWLHSSSTGPQGYVWSPWYVFSKNLVRPVKPDFLLLLALPLHNLPSTDPMLYSGWSPISLPHWNIPLQWSLYLQPLSPIKSSWPSLPSVTDSFFNND